MTVGVREAEGALLSVYVSVLVAKPVGVGVGLFVWLGVCIRVLVDDVFVVDVALRVPKNDDVGVTVVVNEYDFEKETVVVALELLPRVAEKLPV